MNNFQFLEDRKLQALVQEGSDMIWILSPEGNYIYVSPTSTAILGIKPNEFLAKNAFSFIHPDDLEKVQIVFTTLFTSTTKAQMPPFRFMDSAGHWRWIDTIATNLLDDPEIGGIVVKSRDITSNYLRHLLDDAEKEIMALTITGNISLVEIITKYLQKIEEVLYPIKVSLLKVSDGRLLNLSSPSLEKTYTEAIEDLTIGETGGSCGTAAYRKQTVIVTDINLDPLWEEYKKPALAAGLQACWSSPVFNSKGEVIATFANYYNTPKAPDAFELEMFDRSASLIGVILENYDRGQALRESNERYILATRATSDVVWDWDVVHNKLLWTDTFATVFGHDPLKYVTIGEFDKLVHPEDIEKLVKNRRAAFQSGSDSWSNDYRLLKANGKIAYVKDRGYIVRNENGKAIRVVGALADVTGLKLAEKQLAEERNLLKILVDTLPDYIYVKDREGRYLLNNTNMVSLLGASSEEATIQKTIADFVPREYAEKDSAEDNSVINSGVPVKNKIQPVTTANGNLRRMNTSKIPLSDEGTITGLVGINRDVTEELSAEKEKELSLIINRIFNDESQLQKSLQRMLAEVCNYFEKDAAEIWLTEIGHEHIRLSGFYSSDGTAPANSDPITVLTGEGLPGLCLQRKEFIAFSGFDDPSFKRKNDVYYQQFSYVQAIPVKHKKLVIAVLLFFEKKKNIYTPVILSPTLQIQLASDIERKKSEHELNLFFTYSPELLCIAGGDGYFKKVNPAFSSLLGYSESELLSHSFLDFVHPDDLQSTQEILALVTRQNKPACSFENRYRTSSGGWKWISWSSSDVMEDSGLVFGYGKDITQQHQMQQLLARSTNLARVGSFEIDVIKQSIYWSPMTYAIHEVEENFVLDFQRAIDFYREDKREIITSHVKNCIEKGVPFDLELPIITAKGNERWVRVIGEPDMREGTCIKVVGSFQDIHQRKITELALKKAYHEKNEILESIGDAFFAVDNNFIVTYWNSLAEILLLTPREVIIGRKLWDVFKEAIDLPFYTNYHKVITDNVPVHFEEYYAPIQKWFDVSAYPSENGLSVYFRDVTEQKKMSQQILEERNLLRSLIDNLPDTIYYKDIKGRKLISNKMDYQLLGASSEEEVIGKTDFEVIDGQKGMDGYNRDMLIIKTGKPLMNNESIFEDAEGNKIWLLTSKLPVIDNAGKVTGVLGIGSNITSLKIIEDELRALNKELEQRVKELAASNAELEQFAFIASHDLQEPLRMITSFMTLLEKKYSPLLDEKAHEYIYYAVDGARRMRQIILDLLEFSRVNKYSGEKEKILLKQVINEVCSLQKKTIEDKKASITVGPMPKLYGYKTPFLQIFNNLINNALKYSKADTSPQIHIQSEDNGDKWLFEVSDNGIWINMEYEEKIFIIFQRLHGKGQFEGTGMGLAIVRKIIESLGGKIWIESEEGKGTTFYFTVKKN